MATDAERQLRQCARWLRRRWPLASPVRVVRVGPAVLARDHPGGAYGDCQRDTSSGRFTIRIVNVGSADALVETLIEEWAHALRWHLPQYGDGADWHDDIFGAIHNRVRKMWLED